ncbi:MAG: tetratricopeptide repeat protein [Planctomycetota bacterium]
MTTDKVAMDRIQRTKNMRAAEGYLDLVMIFDDGWSLDMSQRELIADRALECLKKIKSPMGHKPYIYFLKGQAHRVCARYEKAIDLLQQSAKLDPESVHTYLALAWCYKRIERTDLAIEAMETAVMLEDDNPLVHYNLACYWALTEDTFNATRHLAIAFELDGSYRDFVAGESDFDAIRNDPGFQDVISVIV